MAQFPNSSSASGIWNIKEHSTFIKGGNWPALVPGKPTITGVVGGAGAATISFSAGIQGGSPITSYTVTCVETEDTVTGESSPIIFGGLSAGTYTFTVYATNAVGNSLPSIVSDSTAVSEPVYMNVLLVAGGGSGGSTSPGEGGGGGGGGGGLLYYGTETPKTPNGGSLLITPGVTYTVTVGAGGPISGYPAMGNNGSDSTITSSNSSLSLTAIGGGRGGNYPQAMGQSLSGGSGGGAYGGTTGYTTGQGNPGGFSNGAPCYSGGGGGGAGVAGLRYNNNESGDCSGGDGLPYDIAGSQGYYAGGGGGHGRCGGYSGGNGGGGGGGSSAGAGGVGGGGGANSGGGAFAGGSGICYISATAQATSTSGVDSYTVSGGRHIYRFTGVGTISWD